MITSGRLLAQRYRLTSRVAVGGMGEVWQANDTRLDRTVAVKILKAELSGDAEFLHRFRTEARTTAALNHSGIAAVHDYGEANTDGDTGNETDNIAYLVMEFVDGEPLAGMLARHGRIAPDRLLPILEQAGRALRAAHERGLVHRDVKPGNILVVHNTDGRDEGETVKLTDFGVAKAADAAPVTRNGMVMGTAHYIAPEQAIGHDAEPASDVYSLGVCGYECLTGHRPFLSENAVTVAMMHIRDTPPPLPPHVPPTVRTLIETTLGKDPARRYRDGGEFAAAVAAVRSGSYPPLPSGMAQPPVDPGPRTHIPPGRVPYQQAVSIPPMASPATGPIEHSLIASGSTGVIPTGPQPSLPRRRRGPVWPWVLAGLLAVLTIVAIAIAIPVIISGEEDGSSGVIDDTTTEPQPEETQNDEPPRDDRQPQGTRPQEAERPNNDPFGSPDNGYRSHQGAHPDAGPSDAYDRAVHEYPYSSGARSEPRRRHPALIPWIDVQA